MLNLFSCTNPSFNQVLGANVYHSAANSLCRIETKGMVLIPLPQVQYPFCVDSSFIYCSRHSNINKLTTKIQDKTESLSPLFTSFIGNKKQMQMHIEHTPQKYHKSTPSFARSKRSSVAGSRGRNCFRNGSSPR